MQSIRPLATVGLLDARDITGGSSRSCHLSMLLKPLPIRVAFLQHSLTLKAQSTLPNLLALPLVMRGMCSSSHSC